jgi:hypothetical protein
VEKREKGGWEPSKKDFMILRASKIMWSLRKERRKNERKEKGK